MHKGIHQLNVKGKRVLVRVDFNVPMEKGVISDDTRIKASLPTIQWLVAQGAKVILMSHLGRPEGKKDPACSLKPCATRLSQLLQQPVHMAPDCIGEATKALCAQMKNGEVTLLENLRFHPEEEKPTKEFVDQLAALGEVYVNDAFGTAHRAHASTVEVAQRIPEKAAGLLLQKEIDFLGGALLEPKRPFMAIIGGAKISSKLGVIKVLIEKVDELFIGGAMAYTFFKAQGLAIGNSLVEDSLIPEALSLMKRKPIHFARDLVVTNGSEVRVIEVSRGIPEGFEGVDIGPKTAAEWAGGLRGAKTIFWNGPLGRFEQPEFAKGTMQVAKAVVDSGAISVVGGGDSAAALEQLGLATQVTHLSTGGGASLEFIEKGTLPGIVALKVP